MKPVEMDRPLRRLRRLQHKFARMNISRTGLTEPSFVEERQHTHEHQGIPSHTPGRPRATPLDVLAWLAAGHFLHTGAVAIRRAALDEALALPDTDVADQTLWWFLAAQGA